MLSHISFPCPGCRRTLKASVQFVGRSCRCPRCGHLVVVPPRAPSEEAAVLVMDDGFRRSNPSTFPN
jgi:DNA-directed RNA polymerase subunit RPC12/RpoP